MSIPGRHSLLWRLIGALAVFCLLLVSIHVDLGRLLVQATSYLPVSTKSVLTGYAREAEAAWQEQGAEGVEDFLRRLRSEEQVWAVVVDGRKQSLSGLELDRREQARLDFVRQLDWAVGRPKGTPTFYIPFVQSDARLVMDLPERLSPRRHFELGETLLQYLLPVVLAVLFGLLLYRLLIAPLTLLHRQAAALSAGNLGARVGEQVTRRRDELGDLARTFDLMAERLQNTVSTQRQLLCDLSHELRTPLSRLQVAGESGMQRDALGQRVLREVELMQHLVGSTLELVWLDTERPSLPLEPVEVGRLWDVLCEDACFEHGWSPGQLPCDLPADCRVLGNLNGLAKAMENILRNAIRYSPRGATVWLSGCRDGDFWHLWIEDQGPGVAEAELERIFLPFSRLDAARPGSDGFGLGLSIANSMIRLQQGWIWAENRKTGLRMNLRLKSV